MKKNEAVVEIKKPNLIRVPLRIIGQTSLIVHAWSEKAKRMMLEAQQKKSVSKKARPVRDPFEEYVNAMYWLSGKPEEPTPASVEKAFANGAKTGFPANSIKEAAISAAYRGGMIPNMVGVKGAFFVYGTDCDEYITIQGDAPIMREDIVRLQGMGSPADLRYRPEYHNWYADLTLSFNDNGVYTLEQIVNMIDMGGFACGLGEWRPENNGMHGMYHVEVL